MLMHQSPSAPVRVGGLALAMAAVSLVANVAAAKEDDGRISTVVNYSDLDLARSEDTARLYARLKYASQKVCFTNDNRNLRVQARQDACYESALQRAVERVNDAKLSSLHAAEPRIRLARKSG